MDLYLFPDLRDIKFVVSYWLQKIKTFLQKDVTQGW